MVESSEVAARSGAIGERFGDRHPELHEVYPLSYMFKCSMRGKRGDGDCIGMLILMKLPL